MAWCLLLLAGGFAVPIAAEPVRFDYAEATFHQGDGDEFSKVIDGVEFGPQGWSPAPRAHEAHALVVRCERPVEATELDVTLFFLAGRPWNPMAEFALFFTTDAVPSLEGNWQPLEILRFNSQAATLQRVTAHGLRAIPMPLNINGGIPDEIYRMTTVLPGGRATGFRLDALPVPDPAQGGKPVLSWHKPHDFTLTEFRVAVHVRETTNIALYRPVKSSHALYLNPDGTRMRPEALTDGLPATIAHPDRLPPGSGFFFEIDLGQIIDIDHIGLRGRGDEEFGRMSRVTVGLFESLPEPGGGPNWQGMVLADGKPPAPGAVEILRASDGMGSFRGRYLRVSSDSPHPYSPQLAEVEVYQIRTPEIAGVLADGQPLALMDGLLVPPGSQRLTLRLNIPQIGRPVGDIVRWRIPGIREEWQVASGLEIDLACPPPGRVVFEAQAIHSDRSMDATVMRFPMEIRQHFWKLPFFQLLAGAGVVAIAVLFSRVQLHRRATRQLAAANARAALAEERARIARDLHDDLGANLAEIAMISELARESLPPDHPVRGPLKKIFDRAEGNTRRLGEIVWAVNPANDTLEHFTKYLCKFAQDYLAAADVRCRFDLPETMPAGTFTAAQRYHLMLAAKEAIHNAVRHGHPGTVMLKLGVEGSRFLVQIRDDGHGCDASAAAASPSGCGNMRLRMETIQGDFRISSSPGQGTTVILSAPFNP